MSTFLVWILISISAGAYNRGNVDILTYHATEEECMQTKEKLDREIGPARFICISSNIVLK